MMDEIHQLLCPHTTHTIIGKYSVGEYVFAKTECNGCGKLDSYYVPACRDVDLGEQVCK